MPASQLEKISSSSNARNRAQERDERSVRLQMRLTLVTFEFRRGSTYGNELEEGRLIVELVPGTFGKRREIQRTLAFAPPSGPPPPHEGRNVIP